MLNDFKSLDERHSYGPDKVIYGHFWPFTSKCDLDLEDIDVILSRDTLSNDGEHMCQMIINPSMNDIVMARTSSFMAIFDL